MSACRTCKTLDSQMPQRVVIVVDGVTHIQAVNPETKPEDLMKSVNYLLALVDQCTKDIPHG
jgi:hypothetical protein